MDLSLLNGKLVKKGEQFDLDSLCDTAQIALYFSARSCQSCRGFTPKLVDYYKARLEREPTGFEIIFVSSDKDQKSFNKNYERMPWATVKYDDKDTISCVKGKFNVSGIPKLVILDKSGELITKGGRQQIEANVECFS